MKATWNGTVVAESDATIVVEGNNDLVVGDDVHEGAAWYYPEPREAAKRIAGYVAFWNGVTVEP